MWFQASPQTGWISGWILSALSEYLTIMCCFRKAAWMPGSTQCNGVCLEDYFNPPHSCSLGKNEGNDSSIIRNVASEMIKWRSLQRDTEAKTHFEKPFLISVVVFYESKSWLKNTVFHIFLGFILHFGHEKTLRHYHCVLFL